MKRRCYDQKQPCYKNYGGRGIRVCNEWINNFLAFYDWANTNGFRKELTLERKDVNGNYCPENCKWVTNKEQSNNKRNNTKIEYHGETKTVAQWSRELGISIDQILGRKEKGWVTEKILDSKTNFYEHLICHKGETKSISGWARITGIKRATLVYRLSQGWPIDKALETPIHNKGVK
jgi:hypothetical protein